jgi:N-methylhydantoinase A/oxoprolinase/acetone carboxylase beta subunit
MRFERTADMRYRGQRKELTVGLPVKNLELDGAVALRRSFEKIYVKIYHRTHNDHPVEALAWRLVAKGPPITRQSRAEKKAARAQKAKPRTLRSMMFDGWSRPRSCEVHSRYDLKVGHTIAGPAVIEEAESTTVIGPDGKAVIDRYGNIVISLSSGDRA